MVVSVWEPVPCTLVLLSSTNGGVPDVSDGTVDDIKVTALLHSESFNVFRSPHALFVTHSAMHFLCFL